MIITSLNTYSSFTIHHLIVSPCELLSTEFIQHNHVSLLHVVGMQNEEEEPVSPFVSFFGKLACPLSLLPLKVFSLPLAEGDSDNDIFR